jgi:hypothetical protein
MKHNNRYTPIEIYLNFKQIETILVLVERQKEYLLNFYNPDLNERIKNFENLLGPKAILEAHRYGIGIRRQIRDLNQVENKLLRALAKISDR